MTVAVNHIFRFFHPDSRNLRKKQGGQGGGLRWQDEYLAGDGLTNIRRNISEVSPLGDVIKG